MRVSIIVPAYNEEKAVERVVNAAKILRMPWEKEIIVVDDGSRDRTYAIARKIRGIRLLRHPRNKGKAAALETGFRAATGDVLTTIDADCTYPMEAIPIIVEPVAKGEADLVVASRFRGRPSEMPLLNYAGNRFFSLLISLLTLTSVTDGSSGQRAFRKPLLEKVRMRSKGLDWEVEMTTRAIRSGARYKEIPIAYFSRVGPSKLKVFRDGMRFLRAIIRGRFL
jgi:glycosyltransferase involved in cell wall biosynthesis